MIRVPIIPRRRMLHSRRAGFTLVELILALLITAIISLAACTLVFSALASDRYLRSAHSAQAEVELASRRIINNIREAQTGSIVIGTQTLTTITQADTADGYPNGVTVSYALQNDPNHAGQKQLVETDPRYGTNNVVANNVTTFKVALVSGFTDFYQLDIVAGTSPVAERHVQVNTRN